MVTMLFFTWLNFENLALLIMTHYNKSSHLVSLLLIRFIFGMSGVCHFLLGWCILGSANLNTYSSKTTCENKIKK